MSLRAASGGPVERFAVAHQFLAAAVELARDPAELAGGLIAELHQMLRDHRQLGAAVGDPLRQDLEQRLEPARFAAHRDHRAGETLGFLAPRAAEHQPDEAHQRERAGGDRDPLRDLRRRQRLSAKRPPGRPGGISEPQRGEDRQRSRKHLPAARAAFLGGLFKPLFLVESRLDEIDAVAAARGLCRVAGRRQGFGALWSGCHRNGQFTIFDGARKRLERDWGCNGAGQVGHGDWRADRGLSGG